MTKVKDKAGSPNQWEHTPYKKGDARLVFMICALGGRLVGNTETFSAMTMLCRMNWQSGESVARVTFRTVSDGRRNPRCGR